MAQSSSTFLFIVAIIMRIRFLQDLNNLFKSKPRQRIEWSDNCSSSEHKWQRTMEKSFDLLKAWKLLKPIFTIASHFSLMTHNCIFVSVEFTEIAFCMLTQMKISFFLTWTTKISPYFHAQSKDKIRKKNMKQDDWKRKMVIFAHKQCQWIHQVWHLNEKKITRTCTRQIMNDVYKIRFDFVERESRTVDWSLNGMTNNVKCSIRKEKNKKNQENYSTEIQLNRMNIEWREKKNRNKYKGRYYRIKSWW